MDWDEYFCELITVVAKKSKDPTTKHGCVIIGPGHEIRSTGYNGFPRKVNETPERLERPEKYQWTEHAERNAIYNAARNGVNLEGCILYVTGPSCVDCARAIIQAGIKEAVVFDINKESSEERWADSIRRSKEMFAEAGVTYREINE